MNRPGIVRPPIAVLAAWLLLAGCTGMSPRTPATPLIAGAAVERPGVFRSESGCRIATRLYRPARSAGDDLVVLAPGFLRDQSRLRDLARALAARGFPTLTLNPCAGRLWSGRQVRNGADMRTIAHRLGARRIVYGGFSAGALSALVAARLDARAVGVLGLDLVDNGGIGRGMARRLAPPLIGLRGDPSPCNAGGNGRAVFAAAPQGQLALIPGASHCDFESPTDGLCRLLCAGDRPGAWSRRQEILQRAVRIVAGLLADPDRTARGRGLPLPRTGARAPEADRFR